MNHVRTSNEQCVRARRFCRIMRGYGGVRQELNERHNITTSISNTLPPPPLPSSWCLKGREVVHRNTTWMDSLRATRPLRLCAFVALLIVCAYGVCEGSYYLFIFITVCWPILFFFLRAITKSQEQCYFDASLVIDEIN